MIWRTRINLMTKTKYPLIMGAFAGLGTGKFAAAFSNAGGLGIITALNYNLEKFRIELQNIKALTDKPFGINITIVPPGVKTPHGQLSEEDYLKYAEIGLNEGVDAFTTSAYKASFIGKRIKEAGGHWFHKCALLNHAISAEKAGADAITLVGLEGGGAKHPLQHSTLVNITSAKSLLKIPIIAAGGIGDARGFIGALMMGAEAVCLGTALIVTKECPVTENLKQKWLNVNIFEGKYRQKIYDFNSRDIKTPSTAIFHQKKIISINKFIENIMNQAKLILKSSGFKSDLFNSIPP
ncbi:MAG: NAD(P)H-dependent flavin oxidoreductase [Candidatus Hermodarchaeota archaeon]